MQTGSTERSPETQGFSEPWSRPSPGDPLSGQQVGPGQAAMSFFQDYARERPEVVAMWAFGIGFILGWKLKPW